MEISTSSQINTEEEYEYQLYGFTCTSVVNGIKDILNEVIESVLNSLERRMTCGSESAPNALANAKQSLQALYKESIEKHTEDLKELVYKYFKIPQNVLLPEDDIQRNQYTEEEERELDEQLRSANKELLALQAVEKKLKDTVQSISQCNQLSEKMAKLQEKCELLNISFEKINKSPLMSLPPVSSLVEQFTQVLSLKPDK